MPSWSYVIIPPTSVAASPTAASVPLEAVVPKDIAIDLTTGDLALRETAEGTKESFLVEAADAIVQWLYIAFNFWLGAWFLDLDQGIPYLQQVLIKNPDVRLIESLFRRVILRAPGVRSIDTFAMSWDRSARKLSVTDFSVRLVDGSTLVFNETPFVVGA